MAIVVNRWPSCLQLVADQAVNMAKRNDRIEALLTKLSEDVTAVRIQLGTARRPAETPAR